MDVQAGLRLCCSKTSEDRFSRIKASMVLHRLQKYPFRSFQSTESKKDNYGYDYGLGYFVNAYPAIVYLEISSTYYVRQKSKCYIFNNIFKYMIFQRSQNALLSS